MLRQRGAWAGWQCCLAGCSQASRCPQHHHVCCCCCCFFFFSCSFSCCCCCCCCSCAGLCVKCAALREERADALVLSAKCVWPGFFLKRNPTRLSRMLRLRPESTSDASDVWLPVLLRISSMICCAAMLTAEARLLPSSSCFPSPPLLSSPAAAAAA